VLEIESRSPRLRSLETRLGSSYRHVVRQTTCLVMRGNKRCYIRTMYNVILRRVREFLLPSKSNKCYLLVDECVRACVRECGYPGAWACACAYVHVALLIQHPKGMRHVVTSFVASRFASDFSTFSHKRRDFRKKSSNIKFHLNPFSGSQVVPCRNTNTKQLIVTFRNFVNAPKESLFCISFRL
jgi:hypothetical protein